MRILFVYLVANVIIISEFPNLKLSDSAGSNFFLIKIRPNLILKLGSSQIGIRTQKGVFKNLQLIFICRNKTNNNRM